MISTEPPSYGILTKQELYSAINAVNGKSSWEASVMVFEQNDHLADTTSTTSTPETNWLALRGLIDTIKAAVPVSDAHEDAVVYLATICAHAQIAMNVLSLRHGYDLDYLVRIACGAILMEIPKPGHAVIKSAMTTITKRHPYENIDGDQDGTTI
jgi:hypothetical protein